MPYESGVEAHHFQILDFLIRCGGGALPRTRYGKHATFSDNKRLALLPVSYLRLHLCTGTTRALTMPAVSMTFDYEAKEAADIWVIQSKSGGECNHNIVELTLSF